MNALHAISTMISGIDGAATSNKRIINSEMKVEMGVVSSDNTYIRYKDWLYQMYLFGRVFSNMGGRNRNKE